MDNIVQTLMRPIHFIAKTVFGIDLNKNQALALDWVSSPKDIGGPIKIEAAAGTGKTSTVAALIAHLVKTVGVNPARICAVSFNKDAALEISKRLHEIMDYQSAEAVGVSTTHSLFLAGINKFAPKPRYKNILGSKTSSKQAREGGINTPVDLIKCIFESGIVTHKTKINGEWIDAPVYSENGNQIELVPSSDRFDLENDPELADVDYGNFAAAITLLHANLISINASEETILKTVARLQDPIVDKHIQKVYGYYERAKIALNVIEFDDMITLFYRDVIMNPRNLAMARMKYDFIIIDEAQDMNLAQLTILIELSKRNGEIGNLALVGDQMQSIYQWRGASKMFRDFDKIAKARVIQLNINYRSCPSIVETADIIRQRQGDTLTLNGYVHPEPKESFISVETHIDPLTEANSVADKIFDAYQESGEDPNFNYKDYAILVRVNALVGALQIGLITRGIPFISPKAAGFFTLAEVQKCIAYLKCVLAVQSKKPVAGEDLALCANFPQRRLGPAFTGPIRNWNGCALEGCSTLARKRGKGVNHRKAIELADLIKSAAFKNGVPCTLQESWSVIEAAIVAGKVTESVSETSNTSENMVMLSDIIEGFRWNTIEKFLSVVDRAINSTSDATDKNAVVISTIHRSKGLQWRELFIVGLMDGIFPHFRTLKIEDGEYEERCLWYVAFTRPKQKVHLSWSQTWNDKPMRPSRFIGETLQAGKGLELYQSIVNPSPQQTVETVTV